MTDTTTIKLSDAGFARRVEMELSALGYPERHVLRIAARVRITEPSTTPSPEAIVRAAVERIAKRYDNIAADWDDDKIRTFASWEANTMRSIADDPAEVDKIIAAAKQLNKAREFHD